jgi:hypothetical protein
MSSSENEGFDQHRERFADLDEAAWRRAEKRVREGADAHRALAEEAVANHIFKAYND